MTRIKEAWIVGAVRTPIDLGALAAGLSEDGAEVLLEAGPPTRRRGSDRVIPAQPAKGKPC